MRITGGNARFSRLTRGVLAFGRKHLTQLVCAAVVLLSLVLGQFRLTMPVSCLWKSLLGVPCPGCGLTRAFVSLGRGDFQAAWDFHPWAFLLFPLCLWYALRPLFPSRVAPHKPSSAPPRSRLPYALAVLAVFMLWALFRALTTPVLSP